MSLEFGELKMNNEKFDFENPVIGTVDAPNIQMAGGASLQPRISPNFD